MDGSLNTRTPTDREHLLTFATWADDFAENLTNDHWHLPDLRDIPDNPPLTLEERYILAISMQALPDEVQLIHRAACITLPYHQLSRKYRDWYLEQPILTHQPRHGIVLIGFEEWVQRFGEQNTMEALLSLLMEGQPIVQWTFAYGFSRPSNPEVQ